MSDPKTTRRDETTHRRADFTPGAEVTLADGGTWFLRKPVVRFVPDDASESGFQTRLTIPGDGTFAALMKRRESLFGRDGGVTLGELAGVELRIASMMLLANYDLDAGALADLLQFGYDDDDPDGVELRRAVMGVADGIGPKPTAGGGGSPPTPAAA